MNRPDDVASPVARRRRGNGAGTVADADPSPPGIIQLTEDGCAMVRQLVIGDRDGGGVAVPRLRF